MTSVSPGGLLTPPSPFASRREICFKALHDALAPAFTTKRDPALVICPERLFHLQRFDETALLGMRKLFHQLCREGRNDATLCVDLNLEAKPAMPDGGPVTQQFDVVLAGYLRGTTRATSILRCSAQILPFIQAGRINPEDHQTLATLIACATAGGFRVVCFHPSQASDAGHHAATFLQNRHHTLLLTASLETPPRPGSLSTFGTTIAQDLLQKGEGRVPYVAEVDLDHEGTLHRREFRPLPRMSGALFSR